MKTLLLLLLLSTPALARINETRAQCEARYGKPVTEAADLLSTIHEKAGFKVMCMFHEGKCSALSFEKLEKDPQGYPMPLSDVETKTLMEATSGGRPWAKADFDKVVPGLDVSRWLLDGNEALYWGGPVRMLMIMSKGHVERAQAEQADKEKSNLKGF